MLLLMRWIKYARVCKRAYMFTKHNDPASASKVLKRAILHPQLLSHCYSLSSTFTATPFVSLLQLELHLYCYTFCLTATA
jgi:hypothetical protein